VSWDEPFTAIVTKPEPYWGCFIHPEMDRLLTVRECARAQTFPDEFRFAGGLTSRYQQVGNAVPPILATLIGGKIVQALKNGH
jgi:DNA (cytosine-5)-methyltransferase 1